MAASRRDVRALNILIPTPLKQRLEVMAQARGNALAVETRLALEERCKEFEAELQEAA